MDMPLQVSVPTFVIEWGNIHSSGRRFGDLSRRPIFIHFKNYRPQPFFYEKEEHRVCILGFPFLGNQNDKKSISEIFVKEYSNKIWLSTLDGEFIFLYHNSVLNRLTIINSRFSSPPFFYYFHENSFIGSFSYNELWLQLKNNNKLKIRMNGFYELLSYKRLFGQQTHDEYSVCMPPATLLSLTSEGLQSESYWQPNFKDKLKIPLNEAAKELERRIANSINKKTLDHKRYGLFLSGGMDTRVLIAGFHKIGRSPLCFTMNQYENREVKVARSVATIAGCKHIYLPFKKEHYKRTYPYALEITGAMQLPMCMFLGFEPDIREHIDVAFHGHGFDYFFQGMYIPAKHLMINGHKLEYKRIAEIPENIIAYFIKNISYKVKGGEAIDFIKKEYRDELQEGLTARLSETAQKAILLCDNPYDIFEYMTFYNLCRHYSFGDHWGINANAEQRTLSFDNDLYELYQKLPLQHRFDARIQRKCLELMNDRLAKELSANNAYPMKASSLSRTYYQIRNRALKSMRLIDSPFYFDDGFQRMGLPLDYVLRKELRPFVDDLLANDKLSELIFLDMDRVRNQINLWLKNDVGGNQLLYALITIDQFLKQ